MKPLFEKPLGSVTDFGPDIDVFKRGTTESVTCGICGTKYEELEECGSESYHTGIFLGREVVAHCCGRIFNIAYGEVGQAFAMAKLDEIAKNPTGNVELVSHMAACTAKAEKKLLEISALLEEVNLGIEKIKK